MYNVNTVAMNTFKYLTNLHKNYIKMIQTTTSAIELAERSGLDSMADFYRQDLAFQKEMLAVCDKRLSAIATNYFFEDKD